MRLDRIAVMALLATTVVAEGVSGQATGTPTFFAPTRGFGSWEVGAALSRPGGGAVGLEVVYAAALDRADLQLRAGYIDPSGSADGTFVAGIETRIPVLGRTSNFPLDGALILGVGRAFGSGSGQTIVPVGLTIGRRLYLDGDALYLTPYAQPTVIFQGDALFTLGLGLDVHVQGIPEIRVGRALGDLDGFSIALFWPR
jgi:hypothetical protein